MKIRFLRDIIIISVFLGLLALPTVDSIFNLDTAPAPQEKRKLAVMPAFSMSTVDAYFQDVGKVFRDRFGFRRRMVRQHVKWKTGIFGEVPVEQVGEGKEGWLFLQNSAMITYTRRTRNLTDDEKENWHRVFQKRHAWLSARGISYVLVISPNKATTYPEMLPDWMTPVSGGIDFADQMILALSGTGIQIVDIRPVIRKAKENHIVFRKTDTHWNDMGALAGARAIVSALLRDPEWKSTLQSSRFQIREETFPGGDLAGMAGTADRVSEVVPVAYPVNGWRHTTSMLDYRPGSWIKDKEPYLKVNPSRPHSVLVCGDSFMWALRPFIGEVFGRAAFVLSRNLNDELIELIKPDIVVDQIVERSLLNISIQEFTPSEGAQTGNAPELSQKKP